MPRAARLMAEVASGLHHAHEQGLVHRDLKPSNIIVTPHDHAKIVDLGLALIGRRDRRRRPRRRRPGLHRRHDGLHRPGADASTPPASTAAPTSTAWAARSTSPLTGQPPFPGGTSKDKIHRHRLGDLPSLQQRVPDLRRGSSPSSSACWPATPTTAPARPPRSSSSSYAWAASEGDVDSGEAEELLDESAIIRQIPDNSEAILVNPPELDPETDESIELEPIREEHSAIPLWVWLAIGLGWTLVVGVVTLLLLRR